MDRHGGKITFFMLMGEYRPEYEAKVRNIFGWDIPVQFIEMPEEWWLQLSKSIYQGTGVMNFGPYILDFDRSKIEIAP